MLQAMSTPAGSQALPLAPSAIAAGADALA